LIGKVRILCDCFRVSNYLGIVVHVRLQVTRKREDVARSVLEMDYPVLVLVAIWRNTKHSNSKCAC